MKFIKPCMKFVPNIHHKNDEQTDRKNVDEKFDLQQKVWYFGTKHCSHLTLHPPDFTLNTQK